MASSARAAASAARSALRRAPLAASSSSSSAAGAAGILRRSAAAGLATRVPLHSAARLGSCVTRDGNNAFSWNSRRMFSSNEKHLPPISDPKIETAFKDLMAASWNELPGSLVEEAKKEVSKATDDKAGQEALENVFRAAEACEEFSGVLVTLRMALDDLCGLTGENVGPLPGYLEEAVKSAYSRYMTYLESFGPEEHYLRKKVETELGTKMIHLKMRCSGIGSEWGKITLIGTSGISGSYVEMRA
ncbi:succinate dehydrogenase subunit 5, mitochondrial-like [Hordeum vulgare]|nr:succinate dehydrogenase subunit 5, mitochondrial-like [Hordeum vulgare]